MSAAAEFYYGKTLPELTIAECAMLASLPKFPSTGNPISNPTRAIERRNYVLGRMLDNRFIDKAAYDQGIAAPDLAYPHEPPVEVDAPYFAEMVRIEAMERLGNDALTDGYVVKTTLDSVRQEAANQALRTDLVTYDRRHGYRGAEAHVDLAADSGKADWDKALLDYHALAGLVPGIVTQRRFVVGVGLSRSTGKPPRSSSPRSSGRAGRSTKTVAARRRRKSTTCSSAATSSVVRSARATSDKDAWKRWARRCRPPKPRSSRSIRRTAQSRRWSAASVSCAASSTASRRATARPGSGFKPFLYSAAFEHGFTPASVVNDAPLVFPDPSKPNGLWTPKNDDDTFQGPIRLREALVKSVNLVSVRVLDAIGVHYAREYITRFGFPPDQIPESLSMALGTASVSPLTMARGYAVFANGGFLIDPYLRSRDRRSRRQSRLQRRSRASPARRCPRAAARRGRAPARMSNRPRRPSALNPDRKCESSADGGAARAGRAASRTARDRRAQRLSGHLADARRRPPRHRRRRDGAQAQRSRRQDRIDQRSPRCLVHAASTATSSVASCWVGFDDFGSLGHGEFGAKAALPIWIDFMRVALKDVPEQPFDMPPGISKVRIDPATGALASASDSGAILEVLKSEDVARLAAQPAQDAQKNGEQREAYDVF